jgi:hypothetical protein
MHNNIPAAPDPQLLTIYIPILQSRVSRWRMEDEEWRAEDISSPIRFCVWLTKTKKEYICTTIFRDWCQPRNSPGAAVQLHYINGEDVWG